MMWPSVRARFFSRRSCRRPKKPGLNGISSKTNHLRLNSRFRRACVISKRINGKPRIIPAMKKITGLAFFILSVNVSLVLGADGPGIFSGQADIGSVAKPGSAEFDSVKGEYLIAGGGENIWFTNDAFHFVWAKMSGDFTLTANVKFLGADGNPHRKACLFVRQSLDSDSAYADVAIHGNGLT